MSAHQMGSARMGISPSTSVCDGEGECWQVSGLFVADASAFPTSSGVAAIPSYPPVTSMLSLETDHDYNTTKVDLDYKVDL